MRNGMKGSKASTMIAMTAGILVMTMGTPAFAGARFARPDFAPAPVLHKSPEAPVQVPPSKERPGVKGDKIGVLSPVFSVVGMVTEAFEAAVGAVQTTVQSAVRTGAGCNDDTVPY
jgi:hypothetical protein